MPRDSQNGSIASTRTCTARQPPWEAAAGSGGTSELLCSSLPVWNVISPGVSPTAALIAVIPCRPPTLAWSTLNVSGVGSNA